MKNTHVQTKDNDHMLILLCQDCFKETLLYGR